MRRRIALLTGAVLSALAFSAPSHAQVLGACPAFQPPPCIVFDISKVAQETKKITTGINTATQYAQQVQQFTNINSALGALGIGKLNPIQGLPAIDSIKSMTPTQASNELIQALTLPTATDADQQAASHAQILRVRNAALDAKGLADMAKIRIQTLDKQAADLQSGSGSSVRNDWENNTRARTLMLIALNNYKELVATSLSFKSVLILPTSVPAGLTRAEPAVYQPASTGTGLAQQLADLQSKADQIVALKSIQQTVSSYNDSIAYQQETQSNYQAMLAAATQAQAQVQAVANYDAARKGVSAASLIATANAYMSRDTTTWDDPTKADSAKYWANAAEKALDNMVHKDVSDSWSGDLRTRAEAAKEEAFFRQDNADAIATEASDRASLAAFVQQNNVNPATLDQQIAQAQADLAAANSALSGATGTDAAKRASIMSDYSGNPLNQPATTN